MTGTIHVLDKALPLPYTQKFYDQQAEAQREALLSGSGHHHDDDDENENEQGDHDIGAHAPGAHNSVTVGVGEIVATGGGHNTVSLMRFISQQLVIHAGETVEWTNEDPITPHTITFGKEPDNPIPPSGNFKTDPVPTRRNALPHYVYESGTYPYICALHDDLGMKGTIVVLP